MILSPPTGGDFLFIVSVMWQSDRSILSPLPHGLLVFDIADVADA